MLVPPQVREAVSTAKQLLISKHGSVMACLTLLMCLKASVARCVGWQMLQLQRSSVGSHRLQGLVAVNL